MSRRLPVELYRDIVDHINERRDLFSLSTTSRSLGYEAERVLYRELKIDLNCNKPLNARIVDHIRELRISSIIHNGTSALPILQSVKNLKSLHLAFIGSIHQPASFLDHCPRNPPFLLHHLSINYHPGDPGLKSFIQSQRQISRFIWSRVYSETIELSPSDCPALISLSTSSPKIILSLLLSGRIHHLQCGGGDFSSVIDQLRDGTVLTTVRALSVLGLDDMDLVAAIFTHLEYLEVKIFHYPDLRSIAQFTKLKKLKMGLPASVPVSSSDTSQLFNGNTALDLIEIWSIKQIDAETKYSGVIYQRGVSTPKPCRSRDGDEWWKW